MNYIETLIAFCGIILLVSLIITTVNQMIISLFNLRGRNLKWGLKLLFNEIKPEVSATIDLAVNKILKYPLISKTKYRLAPVIRLEELNKLIVKFSKLAVSDQITEKELKYFKSLVLIKKEITDWFDNAGDRMSERFALYSRYITIGVAAILAISFQMDSIYIFKSILKDQELKNALIIQAESLLENQSGLTEQWNLYQVSLDSLGKEMDMEYYSPIPVFSSKASAESWLITQLQISGKNADSLLVRFNNLSASINRERLIYLDEQLSSLRAKLLNTMPELFTMKYGWNMNEWLLSKYFGILISIILLSLGAPFWFNALKNLVNLRSKVMQSEEKERTERRQTTN
ncbi:MAG: hypothetical protein JXR46_17240 [Calditrichaceae bacterium]|nr:hypothetical protein [Calditrichaceae bacterium]MBN2710794.1 hypothetical protein [Calditrichaceae bacterium]RQV94714.1 MAG: hypothetical protein EH224_09865 [Calditrichota bacterium]